LYITPILLKYTFRLLNKIYISLFA
jgi:hypothetical protein